MTQQETIYSAAVSPPGQPLEMTLPAQSEWVSVVRLTTAGIAHRLGFSYDDIEDIKLAVGEACNNAILHADSDAPEAWVRVQWLPSAEHLEIAVVDSGSLEPHQLPLHQAPGHKSGELPESGMGLLLIQALMDEVEQSATPQGNTMLRMVKRLAVDGRPGAGSAA